MVPGGGVRCLSQASPSLKTSAIPLFCKIVAKIKSTKLVHNLVYIRTGVTGTISYFRMTSSMGGDAGHARQSVDRGPRLAGFV